jgi:hypothetical protein
MAYVTWQCDESIYGLCVQVRTVLGLLQETLCDVAELATAAEALP